MQNATDWAALVLAVTGIIGATLGTIRWIIRNEVREVKKEFTPDGNGGHNTEGRLSRLEKRVDEIYVLLCNRK